MPVIKLEAVITVVQDRYHGSYSDALYTAWIGDPPNEIGDSDIPCMIFWDTNKRVCGKGKTPEEAEADLRVNLYGDL